MERMYVVLGLALSMAALPGVARAQAGAPAAGASSETIVVTGSLIEQDNLTGMGPVTVITAEDIATWGVVSIDELLQRLPAVTAHGDDQRGGAVGDLAFIELRNLGMQRPLVLVNGRRFVPSGIGVSEAVDLHDIPVAMIERVEVRLDGAPAIHGADAIAGVVNIILVDDFDGARFDASSGVTGGGDRDTLHVSTTLGKDAPRGSLTANMSYSYRGEVAQRDRDWARRPVVHAEFVNGIDDANGIFEITGRSAAAAGRSGDVVFEPDGDASFQPFAPGHRYDHGARRWLVGSQERLSTTALGHYELTPSRTRGVLTFEPIDFYAEGMYTHGYSRTVRAPQALGPTGTAAYPGGFAVPVSNPYIPDDFRATLPAGTEQIFLDRTLTEVGDRIIDYQADAFRLVTGVRGGLSRRAESGDERPAVMAYRWNVFVDYGRSQSTRTTLNSVDRARVLDTVDPARCAAHEARGCVVGDYFGQGSLTQEVVDYIRYTDVEVTGYDQLIAGATVSGDVYEVPFGGMLRSAAGYSVRSEGGINRPSAIAVRGDAATGERAPTAGNYAVHELFAEIDAPLVRKRPGAHELTLALAGRWSHYSRGFGSKAIYRAGLSYAPVSDIRLRSSYSTAYRAPGISQLFGGARPTLYALSDPCNNWDTSPIVDAEVRANCQRAGVPEGYDQHLAGSSRVRANVGGNPNLAPETASLINMGLVFWPRFLDPLTVTVDYYRIRIDDAIATPDPQVLLDRCYRSPELSSPACGAVERGPLGSILGVDAFARNIDQLETSGLDISLGYGIGLGEHGRVDLAWQGAVLLDHVERFAEGDVALAGTITHDRGVFARLRWAGRASYVRGPWSLTHAIRYVGGARVLGVEPGTRPHDRVPAVAYWDMAAAHRAGAWSVVAGLSNVLDQRPPFFIDGTTNTQTQSYDVLGRYAFLRAGYEF